MRNSLSEILNDSQAAVRKNTESVELHVNIKNYDLTKDKRFSGRMVLPNIAKPRMTVFFIADAHHEQLIKKEKLDVGIATLEDIKKLNKNKKLVKKFFSSADVFLSSSSIIKTLPRCLGPHLGRVGKFPYAVTHDENISEKIREVRSTVKFQLRKVLSLGVVVGHTNMDATSLQINTTRAINFLVSLLKKRWLNIKSLTVKSTFGHPRRLL